MADDPDDALRADALRAIELFDREQERKLWKRILEELETAAARDGKINKRTAIHLATTVRSGLAGRVPATWLPDDPMYRNLITRHTEWSRELFSVSYYRAALRGWFSAKDAVRKISDIFGIGETYFKNTWDKKWGKAAEKELDRLIFRNRIQIDDNIEKKLEVCFLDLWKEAPLKRAYRASGPRKLRKTKPENKQRK